MFRIWYTNFQYFSQNEFPSIEEAKEYVKSKSFDCLVYLNDAPVASYSYFGGWRDLT